MARLANPDIATKPGALESLERNEEIWAPTARFFNNYHACVSCPGVTGKQLAAGLEDLYDRLMPYTNRLIYHADARTDSV